VPNLQATLGNFAQGDNFSVPVTVTSVPAGDTLAKAWLTVKAKLSDADPGVFQKAITPAATPGQGQITDTGASGTGIIRFDVQQADTLLLTPNVAYYYDIQVKTAAGLIGTIEEGTIMAAPQVTQATA
jgi:hypothetical protein